MGRPRGEVHEDLRILMISSLDVSEFYGQSTRPYYLSKSLGGMGATLLHICPCPPKDHLANVLFVSVDKRKGRLGWLVGLVTGCIRSYLFRPHLIYVHQLCNMRLASYLGSALRKPLIFDVHGSATQELSATGMANSHELGLTERAEQKALVTAEKVIVVSTELSEFLQARFGISERCLAVIPNGVDLDSYRETTSNAHIQVRAALRIPNGNRVVAFICPLIENFPSNEIALRWFFQVIPIVESRRKDVTFLILGGGRTIPVPSSSVLYAGFVRDLPGALAISDVCVLPYPPNAVCGGVRNKALDYFAAGKPVVSTSEGMRGIAEAVPGRDYLLANGSEEFAERIVGMLSSQSLGQRIGSNGLALAQRYDWSVLGKRLYLALTSFVK